MAARPNKTMSASPLQLNTNVDSGAFDEKTSKAKTTSKPNDEEDYDIEALIDELEAQDGLEAEVPEEETTSTPGGGRVIPEDQLNTSSVTGLSDAEVLIRRKKYGMNQMKEEKPNHILKFLSYFIGPIQFVMEVCILPLLYPPAA